MSILPAGQFEAVDNDVFKTEKDLADFDQLFEEAKTKEAEKPAADAGLPEIFKAYIE